MSKTALITGVTGQDGAYLSRLLLDKGYKVYGAYRRSSDLNDWRLRYVGAHDDVELIPFELLETSNVIRAIEKIRPDEIYNLAAQSFVGASFEQPIYTTDVNAMGVFRILEAIRVVNPEIGFYQASTSEMFGKVVETPQKESTPFYPRSPYGVGKLCAHWATINYRESYSMRASCGILFNHESPLRGPEFVTRKISLALANMVNGRQSVLELGNMDAQRDWGHAQDYVHGMWLMLQAKETSDYVLGTGKTTTVRSFVEIAASLSGFNIEWEGVAESEVGIDKNSGKTIVRINPKYYRPSEVELLLADPTKARSELGWQPKISFEQLVEEMVEADAKRINMS